MKEIDLNERFFFLFLQLNTITWWNCSVAMAGCVPFASNTSPEQNESLKVTRDLLHAIPKTTDSRIGIDIPI